MASAVRLISFMGQPINYMVIRRPIHVKAQKIQKMIARQIEVRGNRSISSTRSRISGPTPY